MRYFECVTEKKLKLKKKTEVTEKKLECVTRKV